MRWIQERLVAHGYTPGLIDGIFGPRTETAVREFQQRAGLPIDGVVGTRTRSALALEPKKSHGAAIAIGVIAVLVIAALAAFLLLRQSDDTATTTTTHATTTTTTSTTTTTTTTTTVAPTTTETTTTTTTPAAPQANIAANPNGVPCANAPVTLTWSTTGATTVSVAGPQGVVSSAPSGSQQINPSRNCSEAPFQETYTVDASNAGGSTKKNVEVTWR